jgi:hypothetical protein
MADEMPATSTPPKPTTLADLPAELYLDICKLAATHTLPCIPLFDITSATVGADVYVMETGYKTHVQFCVGAFLDAVDALRLCDDEEMAREIVMIMRSNRFACLPYDDDFLLDAVDGAAWKAKLARRMSQLRSYEVRPASRAWMAARGRLVLGDYFLTMRNHRLHVGARCEERLPLKPHEADEPALYFAAAMARYVYANPFDDLPLLCDLCEAYSWHRLAFDTRIRVLVYALRALHMSWVACDRRRAMQANGFASEPMRILPGHACIDTVMRSRKLRGDLASLVFGTLIGGRGRFFYELLGLPLRTCKCALEVYVYYRYEGTEMLLQEGASSEFAYWVRGDNRHNWMNVVDPCERVRALEVLCERVQGWMIRRRRAKSA